MRRWRTCAATVAAVALAGACGAVPGSPSRQADSTAAPTIAATTVATPATTPTSPPLGAPTPLGLRPRQTLRLGEVWVFAPTAEGIWTVTAPGDALVLRERSTGDEIRRIEGQATFHGTVIAFGAAWSTDYDGDAVYRYDLESGESTRIDVGRGPDAILATDDAVWIADHAGDSVERLDPVTLETTPIRVREAPGRGGPGGRVVAGGSLWLTVPLLDPTAGIRPPGGLVEIDVATSRTVRALDLDMIPCGIAALDGVVWVDACGDAPPALAWLDPDDAEPVVVQLAAPTLIGGFLAGRSWLLQDGRLLAVERGDPLRALAARSLDGRIGSVLADGDDVWLGLEDRIVRVAASDFAS